MVATISHDDVAVIGDCQTLGSVERASQGIDEGEEGAGGVKDLDPAVSPVGHEDVVLLVRGDPCRRVELTVALAVGAEAEEESAGGVKHLKESW